VQNVLAEQNVFQKGHGVSIGSETSGWIRNVSARRLRDPFCTSFVWTLTPSINILLTLPPAAPPVHADTMPPRARCALTSSFPRHACARVHTKVTIRDSSLNGTNLAVRIKTMRGRGGGVEDVLYENLTGVAEGAVQLTLQYSGDPPPTNNSATPVLRGITVRNVIVEVRSHAVSSWRLPADTHPPLLPAACRAYHTVLCRQRNTRTWCVRGSVTL
jgi:hypothetical protein